MVVRYNFGVHNEDVSTVTHSNGVARRVGERLRRWRDPRHVALTLVDVVRWLGWWVVKGLVGWGALLCADPRLGDDWVADNHRPRSLAGELALRREVERGVAQIEEHLSAAADRTDRADPGSV
jgi:hypothetical protein